MDNNLQEFKFCQKCGRKLMADAEFCDSCGARQVTVEQTQTTSPVSTVVPAEPHTAPQPQQPAVPPVTRKSKAPLIIGICVGIVVLIIAVIITAVIAGSATGGNQPQTSDIGSTPQTSDINSTPQTTDNIVTSLPDTSAPENSAVSSVLEAGTSEIKRSGSEITSGNAFFYCSDGVNLFSISTMKDTSTEGYAISAMIPDSYLSEGTQYDKSVLTLDNCYGEYYVIEDGVTNIYTTKDNPDMFVSMVFTPVKLSATEAEFTISAAISYDKEEFTFEGRGYAIDGSQSENGDTTTTVQPSVTDPPSADPLPVISNKCTVCHGSGICQVCLGRGGMSYATYGQGGDGWVVCEGCKGNRRCKYCNGTGKIG